MWSRALFAHRRCALSAMQLRARARLTQQPISRAGLGVSLDGVAEVAHVGLLVATDGDQEDRKDEPEPAVWSRREGGMESGPLPYWFEPAGERHLERAAVVHRPTSWPVEGHGLELDGGAALPLRPVLRSKADRPVGQLLHALALGVPLE